MCPAQFVNPCYSSLSQTDFILTVEMNHFNIKQTFRVNLNDVSSNMGCFMFVEMFIENEDWKIF